MFEFLKTKKVVETATTMGRDDGRTMTAEEWRELWGESDSEGEGERYILPKMYPGPRIRCPNCGHWQVGGGWVDGCTSRFC